jgi:hypothetical protein
MNFANHAGLSMYLVNKPVAGLRVGAFSCGNVLSIKTSLKTTPSFSKLSSPSYVRAKILGCEAVPKPS